MLSRFVTHRVSVWGGAEIHRVIWSSASSLHRATDACPAFWGRRIGNNVILQPLVLLEAVVLAQGDNAWNLTSLLPPLMIIGLLFYFMILRPERRRRADHERLQKELKKNDDIITIGGVYGTVVNAQQDADYITIKVDENSNTKLRITRSSVQTVLNKEKKNGDKKQTK